MSATPTMPLPPPEFSRPFDTGILGRKAVQLTASAEECAALAQRFDLVRVDHLTADIVLDRTDRGISLIGIMDAAWVQACAVSGEDLAQAVKSPVDLLYVREQPGQPLEEIELESGDCDLMPLEGPVIDIGEAMAQSLGLSINPYATGPKAKQARTRAGILDESAVGAFAGLAALKDKLGG